MLQQKEKENKTYLHFIHNTIVTLTDEQIKEKTKTKKKKRARERQRSLTAIARPTDKDIKRWASGKWQYIIYGFCLTIEQVYPNELVSRYSIA